MQHTLTYFFMAEFRNIPLWQIQPTLPALNEAEKSTITIDIDQLDGTMQSLSYKDFINLLLADGGNINLACTLTVVVSRASEETILLLFRPSDHHVFQAAMDADHILEQQGLGVFDPEINILTTDAEITVETDGNIPTIAVVEAQYKNYIKSLKAQENQPE
jgi:hypothetical protein